ncbi:DUF3005 domain-containing protein [Burkholderia cepacia]|uniref:DUF3005 domain-containing protein n=1 Tax=Burkholderia cepacia TaxID=292 RepID=A0A2S8IRN0_BURCE|nr:MULTISPECIES: DUF3005 domain-containing protein [Burkholderia cepacia complex]EKS9889695.1 DUF3005 domain-containing protein [Burkholderia pyrrocinia]EKS9898477.1 DUF3005 domain-containing protein [Burkholderia pyrrocinia]EKS9911013.1 DUF3005 domain-containing protein [Burkholderia pyrrocinia]KFL52719.1 hypothetical protein JM78_15145 [Burkholderia pyrrocinia]PQP17436.1 DUF3005 domain-containing protein [Burkholderia cepacia]
MESSGQAGHLHPHSVELDNDDTHDSTVDTDGKNREAWLLAGGGPISPDQVTGSNASLVNAMPEAGDGLAGFDSRTGGNHPAFALRAGYVVIEKGFAAPSPADDAQFGPVHRMYGSAYWPGHGRRPERVIELTAVPR